MHTYRFTYTHNREFQSSEKKLPPPIGNPLLRFGLGGTLLMLLKAPKIQKNSSKIQEYQNLTKNVSSEPFCLLFDPKWARPSAASKRGRRPLWIPFCSK